MLLWVMGVGFENTHTWMGLYVKISTINRVECGVVVVTAGYWSKWPQLDTRKWPIFLKYVPYIWKKKEKKPDKHDSKKVLKNQDFSGWTGKTFSQNYYISLKYLFEDHIISVNFSWNNQEKFWIFRNFCYKSCDWTRTDNTKYQLLYFC